MKFSLHNRLSAQYLRKADEIFIEYRDRKAIPDYAEKYPETALVLEVPPATQWEIDELKEYSNLAQGRLTLCLPDMSDPRIVGLNIPFFCGYTVTTFYELQALVGLGASQVRIGAPIFFETDKLKKFNIAKRVVANVAHDGYIPTMNGIVGSWIRPEDIDSYEGIFDTIEFADCKDSKEEALYRIYAEQKQWPGRVDMIITNIETDAYNSMILNDFISARKNCGQRCVSGGACRVCERALYLARPELIRNYRDNVLQKAEEK